MPFTLSHPVVVIPFRRTRFDLTAMIIGSMAPDFTYYFLFPVERVFSHSLTGLLVYCLPLSLLIYVVYTALLKEPLISLLPEVLQVRLHKSVSYKGRFSAANLFWVSVSILFGAFTHALWDSFTHFQGWFVLRLPWLSRVVFSIGFKEVHLYRLLQHVSTFVGLVIMLYWGWRWYCSQKAEIVLQSNRDERLLIVMLMALSSVLLAFVYAAYVSFPVNYATAKSFFWELGTKTLAFQFFILIFFSLYWKINQRFASRFR